jgi:sporulation protein YlmC with PRC-barrel domain
MDKNKVTELLEKPVGELIGEELGELVGLVLDAENVALPEGATARLSKEWKQLNPFPGRPIGTLVMDKNKVTELLEKPVCELTGEQFGELVGFVLDAVDYDLWESAKPRLSEEWKQLNPFPGSQIGILTLDLLLLGARSK